MVRQAINSHDRIEYLLTRFCSRVTKRHISEATSKVEMVRMRRIRRFVAAS